MPLYTNKTNIHAGNEFLKLQPRAKNVPSIFFYYEDSFDTTDTEPYYNPVLYKDIFYFTGGETHEITLPNSAIGQNCFLYIQTISSNPSMASIEVAFNSLTNLPSLPIGNSNFNINNNNRIKRIYFTMAADCQGEIIVIVTDKFIISEATMHYDYKP